MQCRFPVTMSKHPSMRAYVEKKLERISRHFDSIDVHCVRRLRR